MLSAEDMVFKGKSEHFDTEKKYGQFGMLVLWTSMYVDDNNTLKVGAIYRRHNFC